VKAWIWAVLVAAASIAPRSQAAGPEAPTSAPAVCAACVQATMERLAGDELRGRKCGSADEAAAADYIVTRLEASKVGGALPAGGYVQAVELRTPAYAAPPVATLSAGGETLRLAQGVDMIGNDMPPLLDAPILWVDDPQSAGAAAAGKLVILNRPTFRPDETFALINAGAVAVLQAAPARILAAWTTPTAAVVQRAPAPTEVAGIPPEPGGRKTPSIFVRPEMLARLRGFDGGTAHLDFRRGPDLIRTTHNVLGVIHGAAPDADRHAVLLSAHYDHLGVRDGVIFHGANDDASGTAAVLEFARILGAGPRPKRTVYFALFGCEEEGELGSKYFQNHPVTPVADLAANLEFEMIGVNDPNHPGFLMVTGWERSNLAQALKDHGAQVGPDPYPKEDFFRRSDNYQLARKGVVAHTISAWPLPPTYHSATDDLAHVDLAFMDRVIGSLVAPVEWLLNSDFQPAWNPGMAP